MMEDDQLPAQMVRLPMVPFEGKKMVSTWPLHRKGGEEEEVVDVVAAG